MKTFTYESVAQIGNKASIGIIVLSTDETLEYELYHEIADQERAIYVSRLPMAQENTPQALNAMLNHITPSAALLPKRVLYDVLAYGCTSASAVMGHDCVDQLLEKGQSARHYTNPLKALESYCATHSISKIDILSPYGMDTFGDLNKAIEGSGIKIGIIGSFDEKDDAQVARIAPASIVEAAIKLSENSDSQALFISCTNLRSLHILGTIKEIIHKPILSSNQLLAWHIKRLCTIALV